jgi:hypothetical protein
MQSDSILLIPFFIIAGISIFGNSCVLLSIFMFGKIHGIFPFLVWLLHSSSLGMSIFSLPLIYTGNSGLCQFMGFIHYYAGFINCGVTLFLSLAYYYLLILNKLEDLTVFIRKYGIKALYLLACITTLPFITNSYSESGNLWCSLNFGDNFANLWSIWIFYLWAAVALLLSGYYFGVTIYFSSKYDANVGKQLFWSVGAYIMITLFTLTVRVIPRLLNIASIPVSELGQFFTELSLYVAGIGYIICFYFNRNRLFRYETDERRTSTFLLSLTDSVFNPSSASNPLHKSEQRDNAKLSEIDLTIRKTNESNEGRRSSTEEKEFSV